MVTKIWQMWIRYARWVWNCGLPGAVYYGNGCRETSNKDDLSQVADQRFSLIITMVCCRCLVLQAQSNWFWPLLFENFLLAPGLCLVIWKELCTSSNSNWYFLFALLESSVDVTIRGWKKQTNKQTKQKCWLLVFYHSYGFPLSSRA